MKRISVLGIVALLGLGAVAQEAVVKEAERAMKKDASLAEVVKIITPAFSDPSTSNQAATYYIPGKTGFNEYDKLLIKLQLNQIDDKGRKQRIESILEGYDYFVKALPYDSLPDAKGKVKPKYSKDIVNTVAGHFPDFYSLGIEAYNDFQDYAKAYECWDIYTQMPSNPVFGKALPKETVPNDTILAEVMFNMGVAAWNMEDFNRSLTAFNNAIEKGYNKRQVYDFAIAVATHAGMDDQVVAIARKAFPIYGDENPDYIGIIINNYINKGQYADAVKAIDDALQTDPNNSQYYVIKGVLMETDEVGGDARAMYEKAVALDSNNAKALFNLGRMYYNDALKIYDAAPTDNAGFNRVFENDFKPVMLKSVDLFERSTEASAEDDDNEALKLLENAYYLLNDETNMNLTKQRMGR